ncbi:MAG: glycosyl transferase [Pelagibacterium sp. SCN 64-44]|nr:MAG: glycosyl transferase [Pelagibacterium sp. SCN 64-44]
MTLIAANDMTDTWASDRKLVVVVVTYNSADTIVGLLDTLHAGLEGLSPTEIVIADNASSDASAAMVEAHPVGARVIRTGRNGGYAAGINAALATIAGDADVLILNPDIRLTRGAVLRLVAPLRRCQAGVAAPRIFHENGALCHSLRREPSLRTAWADALLGTRLGSGLDMGECICDPDLYEAPGIVDWASGAALAVSAEARRSIGPWDESFFLYSEEVDYQRRARRAGFRIAYVPDAEVIHFGGDYRRNARLYSILTANRLRDYARHHGAISRGLFRLALLTGEALRSLGGSPVHRAGLKAALRPLPPAAMGGSHS